MKQKKTSVKSAAVERDVIVAFLSDTLSIPSIADYSCNGLQVEGAESVTTIGLAVDACMETYRLAAAAGCQMLLVHHGIIWGGLTSITGRNREHLDFLLSQKLNLFAVHLPLDLHTVYGNNASLAALLRLKNTSPFGIYKGTTIGISGKFTSPCSRDKMVDTLCRELETSCTVLPFGKSEVSTVGIVSGGASDILPQAIAAGLDCYITGEPSHESYHAAREAGINVIYAGHYHTEKGGVRELGKLLEKTFPVQTVFIDVPVAF